MTTKSELGVPGEALGKVSLYRAQRYGMRLGRRVLDRCGAAVAEHSDCGDRPVFDPTSFAWCRRLEEGFPAMREELMRVLAQREQIPNFQDISPDQAHLTRGDAWKTFMLFGYGYKAENNCAACPETTRLVTSVPGMKTAFFSILGPRSHVPPHRGPYKGLLRYHLGLKIPAPDRCGIRVADQRLTWREGESLLFDDTYEHEAWNHSDQDRVVLFLDVLRPLPSGWDLANRLFVGAVALSPFVQDGVRRFRTRDGHGTFSQRM